MLRSTCAIHNIVQYNIVRSSKHVVDLCYVMHVSEQALRGMMLKQQPGRQGFSCVVIERVRIGGCGGSAQKQPEELSGPIPSRLCPNIDNLSDAEST